jgi:hypothetical protein
MSSIELEGTLKALKEERAKLDKAITVLEELTGTNTVTSNGQVRQLPAPMDSPTGRVSKRRKMSKEGREKIAKAQKLRWAKVRQAQKAKA